MQQPGKTAKSASSALVINFSQEGIYCSPVTGQLQATINAVRVPGGMISHVNWFFSLI